MALTNGTMNTIGNDLAGLLVYASLHSADPSTTGANETSAGRQAITWTVGAAGSLSASNIAFTGGAANGAVGYIGFWSAATGGTFHGSEALSGDTSFNASGEYTVTSVNVNASTT